MPKLEMANGNFAGGSLQLPLRFTGKERDSESGLDYFGARYYGSALGRFTSPDPMGIMKQKLLDPQQWNMYAYTRDNPLRFRDPTGKYTTSCKETDISKCDQNTRNFENARKQALKSDDKDVVAAAKAYGEYGDKNHVSVEFQNKDASHTTWERDANGKAIGTIVSINSDKLAGITRDPGSGPFAYAVSAVAHEGEHVESHQSLIAHNFDPAFNITNRQDEIPAYRIQNSVMNSFGFGFTDSKGNLIDLSTDTAINNFLNSLPPDPTEKLDGPIYK